ncbi:U4/U6-U5 snRNP complex subunit lsm6 [Naganishia vaughanmartiniae]|uniref:U4/U6-U5 snRNP complex subunit lsm6 n=1 Tax=Naganishia vaughanmartiniae TaxID=1424756 RepID=A0ACC2WSA2_9TREE|nr:U4/U6-U5 snRNP complex subunit lsm6 [Naganishia vaughanmartiniae]
MSENASPPPSAAAPAVETAGSPAEFLKNVVGKEVKVRIGHGIDYQGTLSCLDGYMNVAMENTKEMVDGNVTASFGDAFIRGNNVLYISAMEDI